MKTARERTDLKEINILALFTLKKDIIDEINKKLNTKDILILFIENEIDKNFIELFDKIKCNKYLILNNKLLKQLYKDKSEFLENQFSWLSLIFDNGNQVLFMNGGISEKIRKWEDLDAINIFKEKNWLNKYDGRFGQIFYLGSESKNFCIGLSTNCWYTINAKGLKTKRILEYSYENE